MAQILSYAVTPDEAAPVASVATMLADVLALEVDRRSLPSDATAAAGVVLTDMADPEVAMAALPFTAGHRARTDLNVLAASTKPIVLVPLAHNGRGPVAIDRVLVPLDGTEPSARAVRDVVRMFARTGTDVVVLHVFDGATVPRFWDQPAHAERSWSTEFLARYCDEPGARIELRSGAPGARVVDVAVSEGADLIALAWSRNLSPGHARTVRTALTEARTPLLLVPVPLP